MNSWISHPDRLKFYKRAIVVFGIAYLMPLIFQTLFPFPILQSLGGVFGGDFLAFYTASRLTLQGDPVSAYDLVTFDHALQQLAPSDQLGMMWQYPPAMFLITAPLAFFPYKASFWLWMLVGASAFAMALNRLLADTPLQSKHRREALILLTLSPVSFGIFDNGQISLLTAALLLTAVCRPKTHWLLAGLSAGLLTIKPQLGVLIPFIYVAIGAWRPFLVAAGFALTIHCASILIFGPESATMFFEAVMRLQNDVTGDGLLTPTTTMTTLLGQLLSWGVSSDLALLLQWLAALTLATFVISEWRRYWQQDQPNLYLTALTCASAIVVTPYAYDYEFAALAPAAIYLLLHPNRLSLFAPPALIVYWLVLALRGFLPWNFGLELSFVIAISAITLLIAARPDTHEKGSHVAARA